jgi:hypothetical protein
MSDGLVPDAAPSGRVRIDHELPQEARDWGRVLDLSALEAGDLILFRPIPSDADHISHQIVRAQMQFRHERHAQWTHAAVYLGDDEHICEANFKVPNIPYGVNIRSIFCYCDGAHAIRARRPINMNAKQRLRIAIGAATNVGAGYGFQSILKFAWAANSHRGIRDTFRWDIKYAETQSFVCSTLYQDAYNFAFQGATIRQGSPATPAHLSASADFEAADLPLQWLTIV